MNVSLSGSDVIQIAGRVLNDLADGDAVVLEFPEDIAKAKVGKNGNVVYAFNEMGRMVTATIRLLLGSADDAYLTSRFQEQKNDFSSFILMPGNFSKRVGDGLGNIATVVYQCTGGIIKKGQAARTSAEGNTEQSVAVYEITFGNGDKSIQ